MTLEVFEGFSLFLFLSHTQELVLTDRKSEKYRNRSEEIGMELEAGLLFSHWKVMWSYLHHVYIPSLSILPVQSSFSLQLLSNPVCLFYHVNNSTFTWPSNLAMSRVDFIYSQTILPIALVKWNMQYQWKQKRFFSCLLFPTISTFGS